MEFFRTHNRKHGTEREGCAGARVRACHPATWTSDAASIALTADDECAADGGLATQTANPVMVHSDQCSQFTSKDWRDFLTVHWL